MMDHDLDLQEGQPDTSIDAVNSLDPGLRLETRASARSAAVLAVSLSGLVLGTASAIATIRLDQIVSIPGTLTPRQQTQTLKTAETGTIQSVEVKEGDHVRAGQILVKLSPQVEVGNLAALRKELLANQQLETSEQRRLLIQIDGLRRREKLQQKVIQPLTALARQGGAPSLQVIGQEQELEETRSLIAQTSQQLKSLRHQSSQRNAQIIRELGYAQRRLEQVELKAARPGTILALKAQSGQLVSAGEELMKLVPDGELQAIGAAPNNTIGNIRPGQTATIVVESYDPNLYGTLKATVQSVGRDALPANESVKYPHFPVSLMLNQQSLLSQGHRYELQPGMAITAQIKLQKRTLLQLLFRQFNQSLTSIRVVH